MYVPLDRIISAAGTGYKVYKWWNARREEAARKLKRRRLVSEIGLTAATLAIALVALVWLGRGS